MHFLLNHSLIFEEHYSKSYWRFRNSIVSERLHQIEGKSHYSIATTLRSARRNCLDLTYPFWLRRFSWNPIQSRVTKWKPALRIQHKKQLIHNFSFRLFPFQTHMGKQNRSKVTQKICIQNDIVFFQKFCSIIQMRKWILNWQRKQFHLNCISVYTEIWIMWHDSCHKFWIPKDNGTRYAIVQCQYGPFLPEKYKYQTYILNRKYFVDFVKSLNVRDIVQQCRKIIHLLFGFRTKSFNTSFLPYAESHTLTTWKPFLFKYLR